MIEKYFTIVVKDTEGFKRPLPNEKGVPTLYVDEKTANASLKSLVSVYKSRLEGNHTEKRRIGFFKKEVEPVYTEEQKKKMRWFIANASVQGVTLNV